MRELLTLKDAQPAEQPRPRSVRDRKRTRTMWPVVLTTAAFFAIVLMALRMAGWGR
jgi:hypothetical protein